MGDGHDVRGAYQRAARLAWLACLVGLGLGALLVLDAATPSLHGRDGLLRDWPAHAPWRAAVNVSLWGTAVVGAWTLASASRSMLRAVGDGAARTLERAAGFAGAGGIVAGVALAGTVGWGHTGIAFGTLDRHALLACGLAAALGAPPMATGAALLWWRVRWRGRLGGPSARA